MQSAETVLNVLRERGRRDLPCDELYRQLFNPEFYSKAYGNIYANDGAMTAGVDGETADGMSERTIGRIIDALRHERYRFQPVRRVYIPKKNGKMRPLGLPTWADKLLGEVIRMLLEAIYEPVFSARSHGFRPVRGCHTALAEVAESWTGTTWFIEGDIKDCFGTLDHEVMLSILAKKIHDNRFLRLMRNMLKAGYLEDWVYNATLSGAPQGGVVSPILSNIYLHEFDRWVETTLVPEHSRGVKRRLNSEYFRLRGAADRAHKRGDRRQAVALRKQNHRTPSGDPQDPGFRRLRYIRYADDHLLGFIGPRAEAEQIKEEIAAFLRDELKLELSTEKTLITHARTGSARFLGYEITAQHSQSRPSVNGKIWLRVPRDVIKSKSAPYLRRGKPAHRADRINLTDALIVSTYGSEYRGIVQYYLLAGNVYTFSRVRGYAELSMLKTLAAKHRTSMAKMARKYKATVGTPHGRRVCFEVVTHRAGRNPLVARFGGIPLKRQKKAVLDDRIIAPIPTRRRELVTRLQWRRCELCGKRATEVETHQTPKLADLKKIGQPQPEWARIMTERRRKTLVVCAPCHEVIRQTPSATCSKPTR